MRAFVLAAAAILITGSAQANNAGSCNLVDQAERFIAANADANPQITFISPIETDPRANALDTAYAVAVRSDGYFGLIMQKPDGSCAAIDGAATSLDNPVQWQTARENVRAVPGIN